MEAWHTAAAAAVEAAGKDTIAAWVRCVVDSRAEGHTAGDDSMAGHMGCGAQANASGGTGSGGTARPASAQAECEGLAS